MTSSSAFADLTPFLPPQGRYLGVAIEHFGKAAVMAVSHPSKEMIRFNKYSGIAEWKNALYLWVNISDDEQGQQYKNTFSECGRHMVKTK